MTELALATKAFAAFSREAKAQPAITLRGGNDLDDYKQPSAFDPDLDAVSDVYLEQYAWGVGYLDAESWRHYLPSLIDHSVRHMSKGSNAVDALLNSLRPPDREPPRLASVSPVQESVIIEFLDLMAFSRESVHQDLACQALEEWWAPGALYRTPAQ
jgi:hypothetical protein